MKSASIKFIPAAALALGAFGIASAAHAGSDLYFSVGVQSPGVYVQPAPVYVQPRPVYVAPTYGYSAPTYYGYVEPRVEYRYRDEWRHGRHWQDRRYSRLYGPYGDLDRDGIANRDDRDIDGDGVRNRYDRYPTDRYHR